MNAALLSTGKDDWRTPKHVFDQLHREFRFTLDGAAEAHNALLPAWSNNVDTTDWRNQRVFCNPPYSRRLQPEFVKKAAYGEAVVCVLLIPARPDTRVWHDLIFPMASEIRFVRGRIRFETPDRKPAPAPFPSAVVVFRHPVLRSSHRPRLVSTYFAADSPSAPRGESHAT